LKEAHARRPRKGVRWGNDPDERVTIPDNKNKKMKGEDSDP